VLVLWGAVICLLAIARANLVLARVTARYAMSAFGLRWVVTESVLLALVSAAASLPVALAEMRAIVPALQQLSRPVLDVHLDAGILLFTLAIAMAVGIAIGLTPLFVLSSANLQTGLHSESRSVSGSVWGTQLRSGIVAAQFAFCLVLLAAAECCGRVLSV
jgi:hypothetical protein